MLLQTNSYIVPKEKRTEHARLLQRFKQVMARLGCDHFEVFEQVGANWSGTETGRFVQILRFRDRQHVLAVQAAEKADDNAKQLIQEFCDLVNLPYQQQAGLFAAGYYNSVICLPLPGGAARVPPARRAAVPVTGIAAAAATAAAAAPVEVENLAGESEPEPTVDTKPAVEESLASDPSEIEAESLADDTAFGLTGEAGKRPADPLSDPQLDSANDSSNDSATGEIDLLDYLDDVQPAPTGDDPQRDRLD